MRDKKAIGDRMRAAVLTGPGTIEVRLAPIPEPASHEVRVRLEGCGVCASNLGPWSGPEWMQYPTPPGSMGHEGWGEIDAVGCEVRDLARGDRVVILSQNAYAEFDVAPATQVVRLPSSLEDQPFPGEPIGCAMNIFHRSRIKPGDVVAVVGTGFIGLLLIQLAAAAGAEVIATSRRRFALDLASEAGAAHIVPMENHGEVIRRVKALTEGRFCDVAIEAVGLQWPLDLAAELVRERGTLVIAGYHQDGPRQVNMQSWNWRGIDVVNAHERDPGVYMQGIREAIAACVNGRLDPSSYLTHRYSLEELGTALDATRDRPPGFLKAVITF
jgi:threonine dehydrogenase-like Zn-dependent dehydrogenase